MVVGAIQHLVMACRRAGKGRGLVMPMGGQELVELLFFWEQRQ